MDANLQHKETRSEHSSRFLRLTAWLNIAILAAPLSAQVQPQAPTGAPTPPPPPAAPFAEAGPWSFTGVANVDIFANPVGGRVQSVKPLFKAAVSASWDGSKVDLDGWQALVSAQYNAGGHISAAAVGDIQGVDNIEAIGAPRLYEAWVSRDYDNRRGWKAGLIDLNVDFDVQETGALFLNSSNGIGPELSHSGLNGPSIYPTTALGLTAYWRPNPALTLRAGIFDGTAGSPFHPKAFAVRLSVHDGLLAIAQVEQRFENGLRLEGGIWAYSAKFDALHRFAADGMPQRLAQSRGAYVTIESPILKEKDEERGLSGWMRIGTADPVVQRVSGYLGGGLVYTGLLRSRGADQAGIAISHAIVDAASELDPMLGRKAAETDIELSYRYIAHDWLAIQPDAQIIIHPGGDASVHSALVIGARATINLTRNLLRRVKEASP